jgi:hypothetical protein
MKQDLQLWHNVPMNVARIYHPRNKLFQISYTHGARIHLELILQRTSFSSAHSESDEKQGKQYGTTHTKNPESLLNTFLIISRISIDKWSTNPNSFHSIRSSADTSKIICTVTRKP